MGRKPAWYKGNKIECGICSDWRYRDSGKIHKQRDIWVCDICFDTLTEEERQRQIAAAMR